MEFANKRKNPGKCYDGLPCSMVAVGCALHIKRILATDFLKPDGLRKDGYLSLKGMDSFIKRFWRETKKTVYPRGKRPILDDYMKEHNNRCIICVKGHYIYFDGKDYYSFFSNRYDEVIAVWKLTGDRRDNVYIPGFDGN